MKKCRFCKKEFEPKYNTTQIVCCVACSIAYTKQQKDKNTKRRQQARRKKDKLRLMKLRSRSQWLKDAQTWFNKYIRLRDEGRACISCGSDSGCKVNAGHYKSVGAHPELRFEELNCHLQCEHCNSYLSGNLIEYRKRLLTLIGEEKLNWLEGPHPMPKWTIKQIIEIRDKYKLLVKKYQSVNN